MEELKKEIIRIVERDPGIKATELVIILASHGYGRTAVFETENTLASMVVEGDIRELEYILPSNPDRIKSLYFPAGTDLRPL